MILFRISFEVESASAGEFEEMVESMYGPALARQKGFAAWRLLTPYRDGDTVGGEETVQLNLEFEFDSEENRLVWAASSDHAPAWSAAVALAKSYQTQGFDVLGASG